MSIVSVENAKLKKSSIFKHQNHLAMSKLSELYQALRTFKENNLPLDDKVLKAIDGKEEELIRKEILPLISKNIEPTIKQIERPIVLIVDYNPENGLSVRLTRKEVKTDDRDTKKYRLVPSDPEKPIRITPPKNRQVRGPRTGLDVTMPDGTIIHNARACDTFMNVIELLDPKTVADLNIIKEGRPLVSKEQYPELHGQHMIEGGWLVNTHSSTLDKSKSLKKIAELLKIQLKVKIIK